MLALDTALACAFRNLSGLASFIHGRLKPRFKPGWAKPQKPTLAGQNHLFDTVNVSSHYNQHRHHHLLTFRSHKRKLIACMCCEMNE